METPKHLCSDCTHDAECKVIFSPSFKFIAVECSGYTPIKTQSVPTPLKKLREATRNFMSGKCDMSCPKCVAYEFCLDIADVALKIGKAVDGVQ